MAGLMFARLARALLLGCHVSASQQRALLYSLMQFLEPATSTACSCLCPEGSYLAFSLSPCKTQSSEGLRGKERKAVSALGADG